MQQGSCPQIWLPSVVVSPIGNQQQHPLQSVHAGFVALTWQTASHVEPAAPPAAAPPDAVTPPDAVAPPVAVSPPVPVELPPLPSLPQPTIPTVEDAPVTTST